MERGPAQIKSMGAPWSTTTQTTERGHSILKASVHGGSTSLQEEAIVRQTTFSLAYNNKQQKKVLLR